jgi:hypothetical protein
VKFDHRIQRFLRLKHTPTRVEDGVQNLFKIRGSTSGSRMDISRCDLIRLADEHDIGNAPAAGWISQLPAAACGIPPTIAALTDSQRRLSL